MGVFTGAATVKYDEIPAEHAGCRTRNYLIRNVSIYSVVILPNFNTGAAVQSLIDLAPVASAVASIILAALYYSQFRTLDEQRKLSKSNQCPFLTGPYDLMYGSDPTNLNMSFTNAGNGAAVDVKIASLLEIQEQESDTIEGGTHEILFSRVDRRGSSSSDIQPRESNVQFSSRNDIITVSVTDKSGGMDGSLQLKDMIQTLKDNNVERACLRFQITYKDQFGESEDPFGKEYKIESVPMYFGTDSIDADEIVSYFFY